MNKDLEEFFKNLTEKHPSFRKYGMDSYDLCNYRLGYSYRKSEWPDRCMISIDEVMTSEIHPSFAEQAGIQLTEEIARYTGIKNIYKIFYCIYLLYDYYKNKPVKKDGYFYAVSEMYTNIGHIFYIKWKSLIKDKEYIELSDEVDESSVKFEIVTDYNELPKEFQPYTGVNWVEKLLFDWKTLGPKRKKKEKTGYRFDMEMLYPDFPDVNLTLTFSKKITDNDNEKVKNIISCYIEDWDNESDKKKREQYIHDGGIIDRNEESITIWVDFGSATKKAFDGLLKILSDADLGIELVSIG